MKRIKPAERIAEAIDFIITNAIRGIKFQVLRHPHLIADGRILVHLAVANIGKCATIRFTIGVHPFGRAYDRRIKRVDRLLGSRGCVVRAGCKEYD